MAAPGKVHSSSAEHRGALCLVDSLLCDSRLERGGCTSGTGVGAKQRAKLLQVSPSQRSDTPEHLSVAGLLGREQTCQALSRSPELLGDPVERVHVRRPCTEGRHRCVSIRHSHLEPQRATFGLLARTRGHLEESPHPRHCYCDKALTCRPDRRFVFADLPTVRIRRCTQHMPVDGFPEFDGDIPAAEPHAQGQTACDLIRRLPQEAWHMRLQAAPHLFVPDASKGMCHDDGSCNCRRRLLVAKPHEVQIQDGRRLQAGGRKSDCTIRGIGRIQLLGARTRRLRKLAPKPLPQARGEGLGGLGSAVGGARPELGEGDREHAELVAGEAVQAQRHRMLCQD
mmetsp:Transcript_5678/g.21502  ORF Transcript_5678/g.21502 Transcript_5678/m.21502 type:complete len:340 (-) Transcript_5678:976-1995(-)